MKNKFLRPYILFLVALMIGIACFGTVYAAGPNGEYLQYQEPKPAESSSGLSMITYILSLIITFAVVIGLAYVASRFLGQKMGNLAALGHNKVISTLPLGTNRAVYIVEIAGKFLALGVTDQRITVLQEITDPLEIEKLQVVQTNSTEMQFDKVFQRQLASLQRLSPKFPNVFKAQNTDEPKHDGEKR